MLGFYCCISDCIGEIQQNDCSGTACYEEATSYQLYLSVVTLVAYTPDRAKDFRADTDCAWYNVITIRKTLQTNDV